MPGRLSSLLIALQFFIASICAASSPDFSWQKLSQWLETRVTWDISAPRPPLQAGVRITQEKFAVLDDYLPSVFTTEMKKFPDAAYEPERFRVCCRAWLTPATGAG